MRPLPSNRLDPKVKTVWRLSALIGVVACSAVVLLILWLCRLAVVEELGATSAEAEGLMLALTICAIVAVVALVAFVLVVPPIRYIRWRFEVAPDELDIYKGIIWRHRIITPLVRVQNVDTRQGPLLRIANLASVTVSTAAGSHEIPGLSLEEADELRDKVALLARLAQEDV